MTTYNSSPVQRIGALIAFLVFFFTLNFAQAQWLDWADETDERLIVTTVANSDEEEKDISEADLNNDGWMDVIVVRKEPFSNPSEPAKSDLLLMNNNGILEDQTALYAPEFLTNISFARDLVIADLDADGWQDVVIVNTFSQQPIYYRNLGEDGMGNWLGLSDESASRFPTLDEDDPLICAVWAGDLTGNGAFGPLRRQLQSECRWWNCQRFLLIMTERVYLPKKQPLDWATSETQLLEPLFKFTT